MLSLTGGLLGLIIGAVLGLTGAGGGIFAVPALVFGLGMDIRSAAPVALLAVGAAAALGAVQGLRRGIVRYKAAMVLAAAGTVTAPLGVQLAHWLSPRWLNIAVVAIMLIIAHRMFLASRSPQADSDLGDEQAKACKVSKDTGRFLWNLRTATTLGSIGVVSGLAKRRTQNTVATEISAKATRPAARHSSATRPISARCAGTASSRPRSW